MNEKGGFLMLAVNYSTIRNRLKDYCDRASDEHETVIVTRKGEKNVVILSLDDYNALMKAARNAAYLDKVDRAMAQLKRGEGKVHELIEVEDA
jgi:antitoxin YefM